jgi:phospholipid/cholesterol/gamma-HCH transport system substrate-binding protein
MKDQRKIEIKVGFTVILALLIFLWVLGWAKNWTVSSQRKALTVEFGTVAGLEIGDPITINGVRKGYVDDIKIKEDKVHAFLNLDPDVVLKDDANFSVMMLDLMGGKKIEIYPGVSGTDLDYKKMQLGQFVGDVASSMALLGSVQNDLVDVIKDVKISLNSLNKTLADDKFSADLKKSVANLTEISTNLNSLLQQNSESITKLIKNGAQLTKNVNDLVTTNKDTITQTLSAVKGVLGQSKDLLAKINDFIDKTNSSQNNVGKILNDKDLMSDLKATIQQAKELTNLLIEQLKAKGFKVDAHVNLF